MRIDEIFGDLPTLVTRRLVLRKATMEDASDQFAWASDPQVIRFLTWGPQRSIAETKASILHFLRLYEAGQVSPWVIALKETGRQIGSCGFNWWLPNHGRAELSYVLARSHWGQGLATEAVSEMIRFGFERMKLNRMEALVAPENEASRRVLEKVGMKPEGILREAIYVKGAYRDHIMYAILRRDWG